MNERIKELYNQCFVVLENQSPNTGFDFEKFAELIVKEMHRKVIASILITDVLIEEKGQKPTLEDYIRAINKDFGVKE